MITRRQAIKTTALVTVAAATVPAAFAQEPGPFGPKQPQPLITNAPGGPFKLPPLPYAYNALEPYIDARTMEIHHDRHHAGYVENLNMAIVDLPGFTNKSVEDLLKDLNAIPEHSRNAIRNNGGGHYNHSLFWQMMKQDGGGEPKAELAKAIDASFGSFSAFKDNFTKAALGRFGSGWAWLVVEGRALKIEPTANQDTPLSEGKTPLLGLDVWEHAYYLKYQNKRADYIAAWWNVVNWDFASRTLRES